MIHLHQFTFNPFQTNTYVLFNDDKQAMIVDPACYDQQEAEQLTDFIREQQLHPQIIIATHAHVDHIMGAQHMYKTYNLPLMVHPEDQTMIDEAKPFASMFGLTIDPPEYVSYIKDKTSLEQAPISFQWYQVPGHSPGSIALYFPDEQLVLSGDVLFKMGIGRTDLPGGDAHALIENLQQYILSLPADTTVYPGHGPSTTIGDEKANNPFLTGE